MGVRAGRRAGGRAGRRVGGRAGRRAGGRAGRVADTTNEIWQKLIAAKAGSAKSVFYVEAGSLKWKYYSMDDR